MLKALMPDDKANPATQPDSYAWRDQHIGRLLLELLKDFQVRSVEQLRELGYEDITLTYINVIATINVNGTRLTDIAKSLDVSKQAAGQMVKELITKGYLARQPDPSDGRATLISFTDKGRRLLSEGHECIGKIESLYEDLLGEERFASLRDVLVELLRSKKLL